MPISSGSCRDSEVLLIPRRPRLQEKEARLPWNPRSVPSPTRVVGLPRLRSLPSRSSASPTPPRPGRLPSTSRFRRTRCLTPSLPAAGTRSTVWRVGIDPRLSSTRLREVVFCISRSSTTESSRTRTTSSDPRNTRTHPRRSSQSGASGVGAPVLGLSWPPELARGDFPVDSSMQLSSIRPRSSLCTTAMRLHVLRTGIYELASPPDLPLLGCTTMPPQPPKVSTI